MRLALVLPLGFALACDGASTGDDTYEVTTAALSASASEGDTLVLGRLAFSAGAGRTAAERVQRLVDHVRGGSTCAEVTPTSDGASIVFGTRCDWNGRRWSGTIDVAYAADGSSASLDLEGVGVNGATIEGSLDVTWLGEQHVAVDADTTRTRRGRVVTGQWDGEYQWTADTYTIVSASHVLTVDGVAATRSATDVVWRAEAYAPDSGSAAFTGFRGNTWSFVFGLSDDVHQITVTRPDGTTRTFAIDDNGDLDE